MKEAPGGNRGMSSGAANIKHIPRLPFDKLREIASRAYLRVA